MQSINWGSMAISIIAILGSLVTKTMSQYKNISGPKNKLSKIVLFSFFKMLA